MKFTKNITKTLWAVAFAALALTSCIKEEGISNEEREKISLEAWIKLNKPQLLDNYQEEGGYYVEILDGDKNENLPINKEGNDFGSEPLMEQDTCWVFTNMTGRDINGAVCMTRSGALAVVCQYRGIYRRNRQNKHGDKQQSECAVLKELFHGGTPLFCELL